MCDVLIEHVLQFSTKQFDVVFPGLGTCVPYMKLGWTALVADEMRIELADLLAGGVQVVCRLFENHL